MIEALLSAQQDVLVKEWGLADDASNVLIFSEKGEVLFYKSGELSSAEIKEAMEIIKSNIQ